MIKRSYFFLITLTPLMAYAEWNPGNYGDTGLPYNPIYEILRNLLMWALSIFGFFAIIGFVISGIMYLTASGDEDQQKKAKRQMYWSIIGVVVGLVGVVVIFAVHRMLNVSGTQF